MDVPGDRGHAGLEDNLDVYLREMAVVSEGWHVLSRATFELRRRDGTWTAMTRDVYDTGDAATVLLYDIERAVVLLTRQFRLPAYAGGHRDGMLVETAGGALDGQDPAAAIAREAREELGLDHPAPALLRRPVHPGHPHLRRRRAGRRG